MYPALKRALALSYVLEKTCSTQLDSGLPMHMRIRLKGSVLNSLYLASSMVSTTDASLSNFVFVQSGLENPSVFVSPTFKASFQLA